jgi:hypothetical protein
VVDRLDDHRLAAGGHRAREPLPHGQPDALPDLLLEPAGRGGDEFRAGRVQEQDRGRVGAQHLPGAVEQFVEQALQAELGQRGIGDSLQPAQLLIAARRRRRCVHGPESVR